MKIIIYIILILSLVIISYTLFNTGSDTPDYETEILQHRNEIDDFMRTDPNSPFAQDNSIQFGGLDYYEVDREYKIEAEVKVNSDPDIITLRMSDGSDAEYLKYARLNFTLKGEPQSLTLLKSATGTDDELFFLPFYDETSARETYGGGRYLDPEYDNGNTLTIDFNKAYNPYCAYTDKYACPFPPRENQITVSVLAGEKKYQKRD